MLDFVIVVLGVFIGIQLGNWNEARALGVQEKAYLADLRREIAANDVITGSRIKLMTVVMTSGERAIAFLEGGAPCESACWSLLVDFFNASQVIYTPPTKTVYDEMQRLGLPRSDAVKRAVAAYYRLDEATTSALDTDPAYRKRVRAHISVPAQRALWRDCYGFHDATESLVPDCAPGVAEDRTRAILEEIRADTELRGQLKYWIGMHTLWTPILATQIDAGEAAIAAIDEALGDKTDLDAVKQQESVE